VSQPAAAAAARPDSHARRRSHGYTVGPATHTPTPGASQEICYVSDNPAYPGQGPQYFYTQIHVTDLGSSLQVQLVLDKEFVDNTYGANTSEYWKNGQLKQHTFQDLWKSDRAQFLFYAVGNSSPVMDISVDYLDVDGGAPSGYASQGVTGGDGSVNVGSAAWVLSSSTSLDYNLNSAAYPNMTVDSPVTGANYTPNASYPNWIFDVIYTVVVDKAAFGSAGYDYVTIPYIHASPSRVGQNTVSVQPGPCVPYPTATATTQSGPPPTATSAAATPTSVAPTPNPTGDICYVSTNPDPQHGPGQLYTTLTVSDLGNSLQVRLTLDPNFGGQHLRSEFVRLLEKGQPQTAYIPRPVQERPRRVPALRRPKPERDRPVPRLHRGRRGHRTALPAVMVAWPSARRLGC